MEWEACQESGSEATKTMTDEEFDRVFAEIKKIDKIVSGKINF